MLQDIRYGGFHEEPAGDRSHSFFMESIADLPERRAVQEQAEDRTHGLCLFRDDYILFQRVVIAVSEHVLVGHTDHALLKALADAPFAVFGNTPAFLLRKGREERNHQLAAFVQRIDVLQMSL